MYKKLMLIVMMFSLLTTLVACGGEQTADRALQAPPEQAVKNGLSASTVKPAEVSDQAALTQGNTSPVSELPGAKKPDPDPDPVLVQEQKQEPSPPAQQDQKQASASGQTASPKQETQTEQPKPPKNEQPKAKQTEPQQLMTEQPKAAEPKPAAPDPVKAESLFKDNCMACHGESLKGEFGPNLQQVGARKSKDQIIKQILNGSGDMPGFTGQLDQKSIETLAVWLSGKK